MTLPRDRLIVALDVPSVEAARELVYKLDDSVGVYKIGLELLFSGGFELAQGLARHGRPVFVDAKLLDIEATVERATAAIARMGVQFLTVHALDRKTLAAAMRGRGDSALKLLPGAQIIADPLFEEAPLAAPKIPLVKLKVPAWAVMARVMWHAGYHPEIENYRRAKARAAAAADILLERAAANDGDAVLVAHGYFNAMIGRVLRLRGFSRTGSHRVRFWNAVVYERDY